MIAPGNGGRGGGVLQAVLFDMDGLLVDSEPLWFEAERAVMTRLGGPWEPADQHALLGGSLSRTTQYLLGKAQAAGRPPAALPPPREVAAWLLAGMTALIAERGLPLRPGAARLHAEVAGSGLGYALVTSSHRQIMEVALRATGLRFPVTVSAADVRRGKPHPEPYLRAAALLRAGPGGCVALEDSPNGITSALAAGCSVVAVPSLPVPLPPQAVTVGSLREVSLAMLRAVAAGHQHAGRASG